jgi:TetR/AcrR family transcriptional repressor of nem operon
MATVANTREQIVDRAYQLMLQRGLNGFSYRDISEPLGIKNAAIHYHFPNKMDLIRALVDENMENVRHGTAQFMAEGGDARIQLEGLFDYARHQCKCGRPICLAGALAVDYEELPDEIKAANNRFFDYSRKWLTKVLELGREQDAFSFDGQAEIKAMSILATVQGIRQMARALGHHILEPVFQQIRLDLGIETGISD